MKTEKQIRQQINKLKYDYKHVLTGTIATIDINAPRALMQLSSEAQLQALHWVLGEKYQSKLTGRN